MAEALRSSVEAPRTTPWRWQILAIITDAGKRPERGGRLHHGRTIASPHSRDFVPTSRPSTLVVGKQRRPGWALRPGLRARSSNSERLVHQRRGPLRAPHPRGLHRRRDVPFINKEKPMTAARRPGQCAPRSDSALSPCPHPKAPFATLQVDRRRPPPRRGYSIFCLAPDSMFLLSPLSTLGDRRLRLLDIRVGIFRHVHPRLRAHPACRGLGSTTRSRSSPRGRFEARESARETTGQPCPSWSPSGLDGRGAG